MARPINHSKFPPGIRKLRRELMAELPDEAFSPQGFYIVWYVFLWLIIGVLSYFIVKTDDLFWQILASVSLGFAWTFILFFVHILIHGHVVRSVPLQRILSLPCAYFGLISPTWWAHWHRLHHRFGTYEENVSGFQTINWVTHPSLRAFFDRIKPVQNRRETFFYLFFWKAIAFTVNQIFYLVSPRFPKQISRRAVCVELGVLLIVHAIMWTLLSWKLILFLEVVPWIIQNFLSSVFVVTNHHPKLIATRNSFQNTCSVHLGYSFFDSLFLNIGYHAEHHIFPECNPRYLPLLGKLVRQRYPHEHYNLHLVTALKVIFSEKTLGNYSVFQNNRKIQ